MTQKELRRLIRTGAAENVEQCGQIHEHVTKIGYSYGVYGCNGGVTPWRQNWQAVRYNWAYTRNVLLFVANQKIV